MSLAQYYDESYPPWLWGGPGGPDDPHITSLVPNTGSAAAGAFLVTVNGSNFEAGSVIEIDQVPAATTFVSATVLTTSYDPATVGLKQFTVRNPNEEESNTVAFTVATITADDVSGWTVDEVKDFVRDHPELLAEITEFERDGSARVTLLDWLQTLLDEEDEDPEE